jgi:hypothetical protein
MTKPRIHYAPIDEHAHAIGYVCITWAVLETEIDKLLIMLTPLEYGEVGESILGNSNIRDKIRMLKALAFIRKPADEWYDELERTLNFIDSELRIGRNRYIHDLWIQQATYQDKELRESSIARRTRGAKVVNEQARKRKLSLFRDVPIKAEEIWKLAETIRNTGVQINVLHMHYRAHLGAQALAKANEPPSPKR